MILAAVTAPSLPMFDTTSVCKIKAQRQAAKEDSTRVIRDGTFLYIRNPVNTGTNIVHSEILKVPSRAVVYCVISTSFPPNCSPINRYSSKEIVMLGTVVYII